MSGRRMHRAGALLQPVVADPASDELVPVPVGNAVRNWPLSFELVDHLRANYTPCMTVAFPRGVVHGVGLRFDETLDTTEDWDLVVRAAAVVGVDVDQRETLLEGRQGMGGVWQAWRRAGALPPRRTTSRR